jgi:hypothetical protein
LTKARDPDRITHFRDVLHAHCSDPGNQDDVGTDALTARSRPSRMRWALHRIESATVATFEAEAIYYATDWGHNNWLELWFIVWRHCRPDVGLSPRLRSRRNRALCRLVSFLLWGTMKLLAVVIARNEEAAIGACLDASFMVSEMVVVDSGSVDRTRRNRHRTRRAR